MEQIFDKIISLYRQVLNKREDECSDIDTEDEIAKVKGFFSDDSRQELLRKFELSPDDSDLIDQMKIILNSGIRELVNTAELQNRSDITQTAEKIINISEVSGNVNIYNEHTGSVIPRNLTSLPTSPDVFIGRESALNKIHELLQSSSRVCINGIGGIGKTTIAQQYTVKYKDEYNHLAWLTLHGEISDALTANKELPDRLGISNEEKTNADDIFSIITGKMEELSDKGLNLLVIDNAETSETKNFEKLPAGWHILVTSRETLKKFSKVMVDVISEEEGLELFRNYCSDKFSDEEVINILNGIGYHTLTTEIIAKTAGEIPGIKFENLKNAIPDEMKTNIQSGHSDKTIENITEYLTSIFDIAKLDETEKKVLLQFTALPSVPMDYEKELQILLKGVCDDLNIILKKLSDKGWLQREADNFRMHQLVQIVLRKKYKVSEKDFEMLISNVNKELMIDENLTYENYKWIPFGETVLEYVKEKNARSFKMNLSLTYISNEYFEKATDLLKNLLESDLKNFGEESNEAAETRFRLSSVLKRTGDLENAAELLEKSCETVRKNYEEDNDIISQYELELAEVYKNLNETDKALENYERSLLSRIKKYGEVNEYVNESYYRLGIFYSENGRNKEATDSLEKATAIAYLMATTDIFSEMNLIRVIQTCENYDLTFEIIEDKLKMKIDELGQNDSFIEWFQHSLADLYTKLGQYHKAINLYETSLKSAVERDGENDGFIAYRQASLAMAYHNTGELEKANNLFEKAYEKSSEEDFLIHSDFAEFCLLVGQYEKALELFQKSLSYVIWMYGENDFFAGERYCSMAFIYFKAGRQSEMTELFDKAMKYHDSSVEAIDKVTTQFAVVKMRIAIISLDSGNFDLSFKLLDEALKIQSRHFGKDSLQVAEVQSAIALAHSRNGNINKARDLWKRTLEILKNKVGEKDPRTVEVKRYLI